MITEDLIDNIASADYTQALNYVPRVNLLSFGDTFNIQARGASGSLSFNVDNLTNEENYISGASSLFFSMQRTPGRSVVGRLSFSF